MVGSAMSCYAQYLAVTNIWHKLFPIYIYITLRDFLAVLSETILQVSHYLS